MATARDVLNGDARWSCEESDAIAFLNSLPDDSIDLLVTSPPYMAARTYSRDDVARDLDSWVSWMVEFVKAASPKVNGLIAINCEGQTRNYRYLPAPFLLAADLHRAGFNMRKPAIFHRVGIPGSGGPDWLRNDYEPILCITRPGKLPWSDNTACGHPPKWAPGGEMSHQTATGRVNDPWGYANGKGGGHRDKNGKRKPIPNQVGKLGTKPHTKRMPGGEKEVPSWLREGMHTGVQSKVKLPKAKHKNFREAADGTVKGGHARDILTKKMYSRNPDGTRDENEEYAPPVLANPGNRIEATYTASEVAELLGEVNDMLELNVGGGVMGHPIAHDNEAPFPDELPAFFVLSFCPPNGVTCDPFSGSGTVCDKSVSLGRRFIGCDLRASQVELCRRRMQTVTPALPLIS